MSDVYQHDPDRILVNTTTGSVQAWGSKAIGSGDVVVSASFYCLPQHGGSGHSTTSHFMTVADARSLADALTRAADHAESLIAKEAA